MDQQIGFRPLRQRYFTYNDFAENETIILQSTTGTGKTTAVAKHMGSYLTPDTKCLSITTRRTPSDQHCKSFQNIHMRNYQDCVGWLDETRALTLCINSFNRLSDLEDEGLANYVVYIDEVNSLLEFADNDLLDNKMKNVTTTLTRLMTYAQQVIVSDALIADNSFELLKHRTGSRLFLTNTFQKFQDVPAVRVRDEREFLNKLTERCNRNEPFLFGSDSCSAVTKFFMPAKRR